MSAFEPAVDAPTAPPLAEAAFAAASRIGAHAEAMTDELTAAYAGLVAIADAADLPRAKLVAEALGHLVRLLLALELAAPGDGTLAVPSFVLAALESYRAEIEAAGRSIPTKIPAPMPTPGGLSFADGVKLGIARARLLNKAGNRRRGGLRR